LLPAIRNTKCRVGGQRKSRLQLLDTNCVTLKVKFTSGLAHDTGGVIDQQHIKGEGASVRRGQGWLNPGTLETRTRQRCVGYTRVHLTRSIHGPLHTAGSRNLILQ